MERERFQNMSLEELWQLHAIVNDILAVRLNAKKEELERRLVMLRREDKNPPNRVGAKGQAMARSRVFAMATALRAVSGEVVRRIQLGIVGGGCIPEPAFEDGSGTRAPLSGA